MKKVEAYRVEIPIVATDEYSRELNKANKAIDDANKKVKDGVKAQDSLSKSAKEVAKAQDGISKSTRNASKGVEEVGKSAERAERNVRRSTRTFESFGSKIKSLQRAKANIQVAVKDNATRVLGRIRNTWDSFRRHPVTRITITAVDRAMRILRGIRNTVLSIPTMITIGLSYVGIKSLGSATVGAAMNWEQYEVSMTHWLDGNIKQAKELTKWMGEFADITPYSSPELFPALTRAVSITDKDLDKSKRLLRIASDMAALTPDRSVEDAMQAIANAKMGNTVMLQGFGLDISKKQMDDMGGWGALVEELDKKFKGGAEKLSKTAAGVLATLKGYRGSFMRSIGTGFLEPMKPRLDAINNWLANNQETWGRWKDVAMGHGKDLSEGIFSTLEKGFGHIRSNYLDNPDFMNLDLKGKIGFISDDIGSFLSEEVKPKMMEWWDETGSGIAVEIGKSIGAGIVEGIKLGIQAGADVFTSSWSDLFTNIKEEGLFSKETGKSALGALATTAGAAYLGKKLIYNPGKSVYQGGKKVKGWTDKSPERKRNRQEKWDKSNEKRIERRLARGDKVAEKKAAKKTKIPKGSSKLLRRVPILGAGITAMSMFGASQEDIPGMVGGLAGGIGGAKLGAMGGAALGSVVPGIGTAIGAGVGGIAGGIGGAIGGDKIMSWLFGPPKKVSADSPAQTTDVGSFGSAGMNFDFNTEVLQRNIDNLTMHLGEASGRVVGAFHPLEGSTAVLNHNIDALTTHLGEASSWVVQSFFPMTEASGNIAQNISALSTNLAEASIYTVESFYPLSTEGAIMNQNVSALSTNLAESSVHVVSSFYPLSESGPVLSQNVSALSISLANASVWVNSLYGIQEGAESVKSALSNLANRIRRVPTPSISVGGGMNGPKPIAYAKGGIATSPHLGLVAEAGVPEAMIPWDGSSRSKALWQQTGEALGMFGGEASGDSGVAAIASSGPTINVGDINIPQGNNWSAEEILNLITPALYEKIVAALSKRS